MPFDKAAYTAKLGKLPIWAWGAIGGVGVLGVYYLRKGKSNVPASTTTSDAGAASVAGSGAPTVSDNSALTGYSGSPVVFSPDSYLTQTPSLSSNSGDLTTPDNAYLPATPSVALDSGNTASNTGQAMPTGNNNSTGGNSANSLDAWRQSAILAASKIAPVGSSPQRNAAAAVDAYLAGTPLTASQAKDVNAALTVLGQAPGTSLAVKLSQQAAAKVTTPVAAAKSPVANTTPVKAAPVVLKAAPASAYQIGQAANFTSIPASPTH